MTPYRPKTPTTIQTYHLSQVKFGLSLPDGKLSRYVLRTNLIALGISGEGRKLKPLAIAVLTDFGLEVPTVQHLPESVIADWCTLPPGRKKKDDTQNNIVKSEIEAVLVN